MAPDQAHVRFHRSSSLLSALRWVGQFVLGEETVKLLEYVHSISPCDKYEGVRGDNNHAFLGQRIRTCASYRKRLLALPS